MTSTSAPASMTRAALLCFTPPSTSMRISRPVRSIIFRISGIFATQSSRSVCPPNPGFTGPTDTFTYQICTTTPTSGTYPAAVCTTAVATVTIGVSAAVPTLSEWAMLLLSLGLAGFAARRMRKH